MTEKTYIILIIMFMSACLCRSSPVIKYFNIKEPTTIKSDSILLKFETESFLRPIKETRIFMQYTDSAYNIQKKRVSVSNDKNHFGIIDLSDIPDQHFWNFGFYIESEDSAGENSRLSTFEEGISMQLLRDSAGFDKKVFSEYTNTSVNIDGNLREWDKKGVTWYSYGSDTLYTQFGSQWDRGYLYFAVRVLDRNIRTITKEKVLRKLMHGFYKGEMLYQVYEGDAVEFCLDFSGTRPVWKDSLSPEIIIAPDNSWLGTIFDAKNSSEIKWGKHVDFKAKRDDSGYTIEAAFPWKNMPDKKKPFQGRILGFDIFTTNRDTVYITAGGKINNTDFYSWSGLLRCHNDIPAKWGLLELRGGYLLLRQFLIPLIIFVSVFLVFLWKWAKNKSISGSASKESKNILCDRIIETISESYMDETLSAEFIADKLSITPNYVGKVLKNQTGKSVPYYINYIRIEKAKELLIKSNLNISQISYNTGYSNPSVFSRKFTEFTKMSPSEFRKKA
ncbi:MAG: helix-turn-helix domain-containing protein [Fibrobacterota bacterium]